MCENLRLGAHRYHFVLIISSLLRVVAADAAAAPLQSALPQIHPLAVLEQPRKLPTGYLNGVLSLKQRLLANNVQLRPPFTPNNQQQSFREVISDLNLGHDMNAIPPNVMTPDQLHQQLQQLEVDLHHQDTQLQQREKQLAAQVASGQLQQQQQPQQQQQQQQQQPQQQQQQQQQMLEPVKMQFELTSGNQPQLQLQIQDQPVRDSQTDAESTYDTKMQLLQQLADSLTRQQQQQPQQQLPQQQQSLRTNVAQLSPSDPAAGAEEETCSEECATTDRDVEDDEEDDEDKCDNTTLEPTQCTQANATQAGKATTPQVESLTIRVDPNRNLTKTTAQPKTTAAAGKQTKPQSTAPTKLPFAKTTKSKKAKKPCCIKPAKKPRNSLSQNLRKVWQEPKQRIDRASPSDKANLRIDAIATWLQYRKMHSKDALRPNRATRQQRDKRLEVKKSKKCQIWAKKKPRKQRGVVDRKQVLQAETKLWPLKGSH
ncbi:transcription factor SPT20 homolog [Drosophila mojavensis]|uniref:Uncharacterized protein n=1 Tax=Drosophila mojavensis TaxID=7230 RepID=B4KYR0_DROMO|nr:transcription factor SPT20 homolog [Drosophila mojavensis]EDW17774.2 uncharacterized protein Dmoj_GI12861 [Drosophila mojavensis]